MQLKNWHSFLITNLKDFMLRMKSALFFKNFCLNFVSKQIDHLQNHLFYLFNLSKSSKYIQNNSTQFFINLSKFKFQFQKSFIQMY